MNLLFSTLHSDVHEQVVYTVCQACSDIMIHSTCTASPKKFDKESDKWSVYAALEPEDVSMLLQEASQFLLQYLNRGNFEGSGGAD